MTDNKELDRAIALAGQVVEQAQELQKALGYKPYPSTAEALLEMFKEEMLAKLKVRAVKHPNDNFLELSVEEMMNYSLQPIVEHADKEIEELYVARKFEGPVATMKENVDNANMNFIEWALLKVKEPVT